MFTIYKNLLKLDFINPLSTNVTKWSNTLKQFVGKTNCLSVFNHFVGLALKGLRRRLHQIFMKDFILTHFSPKLHSIKKPAITLVLQIKWLVSIWNATLSWNRMLSLQPSSCFSLNSYEICGIGKTEKKTVHGIF